MARSKNEQLLHDWVIERLKEKYSRMYKEIHVNPGNEKNFEFKGHYPDAVFVNYGQVILIVEVETQETINAEEAQEWKELSELGVQLVLLVPRELQNLAREICWKKGIAAKVKLGSFDVVLSI
ncbi:MAG: hypothetical protein KatS3mg078_0345 [Deltaproteobacteria bacterium]|jgi:hypothetical protein|nr:MAG: hypothetical protein KatS3mg078_0345 [Deltaproteobacteria bacterium]